MAKEDLDISKLLVASLFWGFLFTAIGAGVTAFAAQFFPQFVAVMSLALALPALIGITLIIVVIQLIRWWFFKPYIKALFDWTSLM